MIDASIFKAYDIRGLCPGQLDEGLAYRVGRAFVRYLNAKRIGVGHDARPTSPGLAQAFMEGARSEGCAVRFVGLAATDMVYYQVAKEDQDGGAIITASHNPKEYNGIKLMRRGALALSGDEGIKEIREALTAGEYEGKGPKEGPPVERIDILEEYARHCLSFIDPAAIGRMKVVMDAGNGMGSIGARAAFSKLPLEIVPLYFEPDGTFPNHPPDPLEEKNRAEVTARVKKEKAALGIAWDGDADRCFFIDDTGTFVPGDFATALLGEVFCSRESGARIVYDVRASRAVADRVQAAGGVPLMNRVGHAFIKKRMRDERGAFGGEVSGHFYFRENFFADNGMIPALMMLELVSRNGGSLSRLAAPLRERYFLSGEINSKVKDVPKALAAVRDRYKDGRIGTLDGVSVDYEDWHFNVRPSNTEPLIRLNLEAYSRQEMEQRRDEVLSLIRSAGGA
jgi:phosphomannomutase